MEELESIEQQIHDPEFIDKIKEARDRDYAYDGLEVNPLGIREGERMLKMKLIERLTLEDLGYK